MFIVDIMVWTYLKNGEGQTVKTNNGLDVKREICKEKFGCRKIFKHLIMFRLM